MAIVCSVNVVNCYYTRQCVREGGQISVDENIL